MSIEVRVPTLPESVADATLVSWHKQPGDQIQRDENLVDLETDKVVLEIPAPADGVLGQILQGDGSTVRAGDLIAYVEASDSAAVTAAEPPAATTAAGPAASTAETSVPSDLIDNLSPAVRRLINEQGLDPRQIPASGRGGRITKADVLAYLEQPAPAEPAPAEPAPTTTPPPSAPPVAAPPSPAASAPSVPPDPKGRVEQRVAMTRLRQRIADRLVQAQQTAAILTTFNEVDMQPVMMLRNRYKDKFEKEHGARLGFMSFFVKASIEALKRFPAVNASLDGSDMIYHGYYDIGIAVSSPRGLVVPIMRDADQLSFAEIENTVADFGKRAQSGALTMEDLTGGTFSITNGGVFGSLVSTPILNPPQSAILGMHKIQERPVVDNGQIVIRPMMYLALSYDHRIIDGREAVSFLVAIKNGLEDPTRLLLQL